MFPEPGDNPSLRLAVLRSNLLERLASRVHSGLHSNIVGGPGTGKTALLRALQTRTEGQDPDRLRVVAIDPNELGPGADTLTRFWDTLARATDTPRDCSRERHAAILHTLRSRNQRLLLVVHKIDELVARPWACDAGFLGTLRVFSNAEGSKFERGPISLLSTGRRGLSGIHGFLEKRLGRFPGSPPLNFMQDFPLDPPTRDEILAYAQERLSGVSRSHLSFIYDIALGHPRLTTAFVESLLHCLRDLKPRQALCTAAQETLDSHDDVFRQVFAGLPPQYAFALLCEVLQGYGSGAAPDLAVAPAPPVGSHRQGVTLRDCERELLARFGNSSDAHASLSGFDPALAQSLPNEVHATAADYVSALVRALHARGALRDYLSQLAVASSPSSERLIELVEQLERRASTGPVLTLQRARVHYIFGEGLAHLTRQAVIRKDDPGTLDTTIAHLWKWWLLRQLGDQRHRLDGWLQDLGLTEFAGGEPLAVLQRLVAGAASALDHGSESAISREVSAHGRRR